MTDREKSMDKSLKRIAKATEEISRLLRESGSTAAKASTSFGEVLNRLENEGTWPSYDN